MYIFVSFQEQEQYYKAGPSGGLTKARLEEASGQRCLLMPYREFGPETVEEFKPAAVVMGGFAEPEESRDYAGVRDVLMKSGVPMLCFCGSHQLIDGCLEHGFGEKEGWKPEPMRKIRPGEDFPRVPRGPVHDRSEFFLARGFFPVRRVEPDPIFKGLPETMVMKCSHYCEVKKLPRGFKLLACSAHCGIEMMRHESRLLYGTQFHPEAYAEPFMHGKKLLSNFADIVENSS